MPFDEEITKNKIQELISKQNDIQIQRTKIHETINNLQGLLDVPEEIPGGGAPKKMKKPKDKGTGKEMTVKRRDEIFDAMITEADLLLE